MAPPPGESRRLAHHGKHREVRRLLEYHRAWPRHLESGQTARLGVNTPRSVGGRVRAGQRDDTVKGAKRLPAAIRAALSPSVVAVVKHFCRFLAPTGGGWRQEFASTEMF